MKINFDETIKNFEGKDVMITDVDRERPFTLRDVAVNSLVDERVGKIEAGEKYARGRLADRIFGCKEPIDLPVEDIALLKRLSSQTYGPLVVLRAWDMLDKRD